MVQFLYGLVSFRFFQKFCGWVYFYKFLVCPKYHFYSFQQYKMRYFLFKILQRSSLVFLVFSLCCCCSYSTTYTGMRLVDSSGMLIPTALALQYGTVDNKPFPPEVMDHSPIRQTFKFENNFSTVGKSVLNLV